MRTKINLAKIRRIRKEKGISQTFIAKRLGYTHTSGYSNIENGRTDMKAEHLVIIAETLGVPIDDLLNEERDSLAG